MRSDNMPREEDIVERLRALGAERAGGSTSEPNYDPALLDCMYSAADEIERLREIERENDSVIAVWRCRCNEAEDERDKLREDVAQLRDLLADLELTREGSKVAHAELKELKKDKAWRFEVCERLGMSCAAGKEWSTDELWWHVQWLEELARRPAESELSALRARIEVAEAYIVSKMPGSAFGWIALEPWMVGKRVRLVMCDD